MRGLLKARTKEKSATRIGKIARERMTSKRLWLRDICYRKGLVMGIRSWGFTFLLTKQASDQ